MFRATVPKALVCKNTAVLEVYLVSIVPIQTGRAQKNTVLPNGVKMPREL
jgi:hypothetical protein